MSRLQERLQRMVRDKPAAGRGADISPQETEASKPGPEAAWLRLDAAPMHTVNGEFIRRKVSYPLDSMHGDVPLGTLTDEAEALTAMLADKARASWEKLLFFDTETTGLGVGAGNVPFMLGFGYYSADSFTVEQCVLRSPADEPAMLAYFAGVLERFTHVVSYNGRSFDWPVLRNRFVMNRVDWSDEHLHQLDFLYPSRNLWRRILPSCSLGSVEAGRLGFVREDDVPGSLAPTLYFQFLQSGDPELLRGVLVHNERDILSLAGLASYFAGVLSGRVAYLNMESDELLRLALWLDKIGRKEQADEAFAWLLRRPEEELRDVAPELAASLKRRGRYDDAVRLWKLCAAEDGAAALRLDPYIELAMYYEHRAKQPEEALYWTTLAGEIAAKRYAATRRSAKEKALVSDIAKRRRRLLGKLERAQAEHESRELFAGDLFE